MVSCAPAVPRGARLIQCSATSATLNCFTITPGAGLL